MSFGCRASRGCGRIVPLAAVVASCAGTAPRVIPPGVPSIAVVVPVSEGDALGILVDGEVQRGRWYCSSSSPPLTYEIMFFDGTPRAIQAVGFVPANVGPDGVGPVRVRVQTGHGVMAAGQTYRVERVGAVEGQQVVVLPRAVTGDHVVITFERRSRYATALCLGEITAWGEDYPRANVTAHMGQPYESSGHAGSDAPTASSAAP